MKTRIKLLTRLLLVTLLFSFIGCSEDLYDDNIFSSKKIKITEKKFNELSKNERFSNLISLIIDNNNARRSELEDQFGFTISEGNVKIIETDTLTSYTMLIHRDGITDTTYFENLVVQNDIYDNKKVAIFKYIPSSITASGHNSFQFQGNIQKTNIDFSDGSQNAIQSDCFVVQTMCNESWNNPGTAGGSHAATSKCTNPNFLYTIKYLALCAPDNGGFEPGGGAPIDFWTFFGYGNTASGGGGPTDNGHPTAPQDYEIPEITTSPILNSVNSDEIRNINLYYQSLSYQELQWVMADPNHQIIFNQLIQYLRNNNWSLESKNFARELIEDLVNFPISEGNDGNAPDFNYEDYSNVQTQTQSLPNRNGFYNVFPKIRAAGMPAFQVYQLIGGTILNSRINQPEKYKNACALRVSRALNYSGNQIPVFYNNEGIQRTQKGADNLNYILDAASLLAYMKKTFPNSNPIHLVNKTPTQFKSAINGKWGIYIMLPKDSASFGATGHADFWSNTGCLSGSYFDKAKEIYFWELF